MAHTALKTPTKVAEFIIAHNRQFEERILQIRQQIIIKTQQRLTFEKEILASKSNEIQTSFRILLQTQSEQLQSIKHKLLIQTQGVLNKNSDSLNELSQKLSLRPATIISNARNNFENKKSEFEQIVLRSIKNQENKLQHFTSLFRVLSPANTLKRGFAIVIKEGVIQTDARQIKKQDSIQVYLGDSELDVSVIKKQKKDGKQFNL
jgi:exodeoxyribonuclease VII large subunit